MFSVYVLYSKSFQKIYVGFTSDLSIRLKYHNELSSKGWTKRYRPWVVAYVEEFQSKKDAMAREKELKSYRGREFIWKLVYELNKQ